MRLLLLPSVCVDCDLRDRVCITLRLFIIAASWIQLALLTGAQLKGSPEKELTCRKVVDDDDDIAS